jgi:hypothetical protein
MVAARASTPGRGAAGALVTRSVVPPSSTESLVLSTVGSVIRVPLTSVPLVEARSSMA